MRGLVLASVALLGMLSMPSASASDRQQLIQNTIAQAKALSVEKGRAVLELEPSVCRLIKQTGRPADLVIEIQAREAGFDTDQTTFMMSLCTLELLGVSKQEFQRAMDAMNQ